MARRHESLSARVSSARSENMPPIQRAIHLWHFPVIKSYAATDADGTSMAYPVA